MTNERDNEQWQETRSQIKNKFNKLSDKQLDGLNGHMEKLPGMVENTYDYDHEKAVEVCKPFTESSRISK